jgi:hypothetical protein
LDTKYREEIRREKISKSLTGRKLSEEHKNNIKLSFIKKPWTLKQRLEKSRIMTGRKYPERSNEKHHNWKGDNVCMSALHEWVRNHHPEPDLCQICQKEGKKDLANITGVYKRDFINWLYLCRSCHCKVDKKINNITKSRTKDAQA